MTIDDAQKVTTRIQLAEFVERVRREVLANPESVENPRLENYLEALSAYLRDLPGFVRNNNWPGTAENPTWSLIAAAIAGAVVYE